MYQSLGAGAETSAIEMDTNVLKSRSRKQSATPLVVQQIKNSTAPEFRFFGKSVQILYLVGIIRDIRIDATDITCYIEDSTGTIMGQIPLDPDDVGGPQLFSVKTNTYAQVFGTLKHQGREKVVLILKMFPIKDANIITNHLLEVIATRLEAEAEYKRQVSSANSVGAALARALGANTEDIPSSFQEIDGSSHIREEVFNIIKAEKSQFGISQNDVLQQFPAYHKQQVIQMFEHLLNEGAIFSTLNNHYRALDN